MILESFLKWLSALILLYFAGTFFLAAATIGWLNEGTDRHALLTAMFIALPGVVSLVASYRQLFQPHPYLVLTAIILAILVVIGAIFEFSQNSYTVGYSLKEILGNFALALVLLVIPLYSNFSRHRKNKLS